MSASRPARILRSKTPAIAAVSSLALATLLAVLAGSAAAAGPQFTGTIPTLGIWAGTENLSAYNFSLNFWDPDGDPLAFIPYYAGGFDPSVPSVPNFSVSFNGSIMELRSTSASDWGVQWLMIRAEDPGGSRMYSNVFMIHVGPQPVSSREWHNYTEPGSGGSTGNQGCTSSGPGVNFASFPSDARLVEYSRELSAQPYPESGGGNNSTEAIAGATSVRVVYALNGTEVLNRSIPETRERVYFDTSPMNAYIAADGGLFGIVDVPMTASICAWDGRTSLTIANRTYSYVRLPANDTGDDLDANAPTFNGTLPNLRLDPGGNASGAIDLSDYFADADGDPLEYTVFIADAPGYVDGAISFDLAAGAMGFRMLDPNWTGNMSLYIVARDPAGASARGNNFTIRVSIAPPVVNAPPAPTQPLPALSALAGDSGRALIDLAAYFTDDGPASELSFGVIEGTEAEWADVDTLVAGSILSLEFLAPMPPASLTLQIRVADAYGASYLSPSVPLTIEPRADNHAPQIVAPASASVALGASVTVAVSGSDSDSDTLAWQILASSPGLVAMVDAQTGLLTLYGSGLTESSGYSVSLRADDGWGAFATATVAVTVWDPAHLPAVSAAAAPDGSGALWVNGSVVVGAQPAGAAPLAVHIEVDGESVAIAEVLSGFFAVRLDGPFVAGTHTVRVSITDGYGRTGSATGAFDVLAPPPAVPHLVAILSDGTAPSTFDGGTVIGFALTTDAPLLAGVTVSWYLDGAWVGNGSTIDGLQPAPGAHTIEARASNGEMERTISVGFTVNARVTPSVPPSDGGAPLVWAILALGVVTVGVFLGRTESGRYLLLAALVGSVFSKLKRPSLLDHFVRGALYQEIRREPGIHFEELRRRTALPAGQASHHLRMLEKGGYIRVVIQGANTRFFTTDHKLDPAEYGLSPKDREVLEAVAGQPGITQRDLSVRLRRSSSAVSRSVSRLTTLGYTVTVRKDRGVAVFPRPPTADAPTATRWPDEGA